jgi:hypothetical protein
MIVVSPEMTFTGNLEKENDRDVLGFVALGIFHLHLKCC